MSIYRHLSYAVVSLAVLVLVVLPATLFTLLTTHTGSQWLINLSKPLIAESITFDRFEGALANKFSVTDLRIDTNQFAAQFASVDFTWSPSKLLDGRLVIEQLLLGTGKVRLRASDTSEQPQTPSNLESLAIELPLTIELKRFKAKPSWFFINDAPEQKLGLTAKASVSSGGNLEIAQFVVQHQYTTLDLSANATLTYPFDYQLQLAAQLHSPDYPEAAFTLTSIGDLNRLSGSFIGQENLAANADFVVNEPLSELDWRADLQLSQLQPAAWINALAPTTINEAIVINGTAALRGNSNVSVHATPKLTVSNNVQSADITGEVTVKKKILTVKQLASRLNGVVDGAFTLTGTVDLNAPLAIDMMLQSDNIAYQNTLTSGQVKAKGTLNSLTLDTDMSTELANQHQFNLLAQAQLSESQLTLNKLQLSDSEFGGRVSGQAKLSWHDGINLQSSIEGELFQQPLSLVTELKYQKPYIKVDNLDFQWQGITATAEGMMAPGRQLHIDAKIPTLARVPLLPVQATGALALTATLEGDLNSPWAEIEISSEQLNLQDQSIKDFNLHIAGGLDQQTLKLQAIAANTGIDLNLASQLQSDVVKLTVHELTLHPEDLKRFNLTQKATISYRWQDPRLMVDNFCLKQDSTTQPICLKATDSAPGEHNTLLQLTARQQPLSLINYFVPNAQVTTSGDLDIDISSVVNLSSYQPTSLHATLKSDNLVLSGLEDSILVDQLLLEVKPEAGQTSLKLSAVSEEIGLQLDGQAMLSRLAGDGQLDGSVSASLEDIGIAEVLLPTIGAAKGQLDANVVVSGQLNRPTVMPRLTAVINELLINPTGTLVTATKLTVEPSTGDQFSYNLQGSGSVGDGQFTLSGQTHLKKRSFAVKLTGQQLRLLDTPELSVHISPDMQVTFADRHLSVSGDIHVPKALITPLRLSGAMGPSADVVVKQQKTTGPETNISTDTAINLTLGDNVRVAAYGFEGDLTGGINVSKSSQSIARATGKVGVKSGTYEVYGQELTIDKGQLIYNGGPVDNPGLNLQVVRELTDSGTSPDRVGAQVRGTLIKPELNLFSDPAMPDASVLSYLLFGRPPNPGSESSNLELQAALLLTGNITESFAESLKETFGFDEVAVESDTKNVNDTSLYLGKYLSPRLYVKYGIGLIESKSSFLVRYQLTEHLWIESVSSSDSQSGDLMYSIEK
ncbi:MAG: translocation/assembly module TamB domain-containing protein [Pseudomonadota bacterium]